MTRYYSLDRTMLEAADDQERARDVLLDSLGATPEKLEGARRILKLTGHDRAPDQRSMGRQAAGIIAGEAVAVEERHTNAHGEQVTVAYRRNGPHLERIRIREEHVAEHTFVVTEHNGQNRFGRRT